MRRGHGRCRVGILERRTAAAARMPRRLVVVAPEAHASLPARKAARLEKLRPPATGRGRVRVDGAATAPAIPKASGVLAAADSVVRVERLRGRLVPRAVAVRRLGHVDSRRRGLLTAPPSAAPTPARQVGLAVKVAPTPAPPLPAGRVLFIAPHLLLFLVVVVLAVLSVSRASMGGVGRSHRATGSVREGVWRVGALAVG
mmetsp:Transcript_1888/g.3993  ORF Transcript_1888/g.3993 Transcript_1888/m.3993 type:complete len:200 (+) Transcript_1888:982-1581(+)